MNNTRQPLRRVCAVLIGIVFFAAGLLKLQDPVGAGLVVKEYFSFFHVSFLDVLSKPLGTLMAFVETVCGFMLMAGVARKATAMLTMALTAFFTLITILLVIFNPVMDCGCFGEAVHLSHVQTLIKNIVICALCAAAFLPLGKISERPDAVRTLATIAVVIALAFFGVWSWLRLPSVDFMAFKPGAILRVASGDASSDTLFIYTRGSQEGAFTSNRMPDSTWTYQRLEASGADEYFAGGDRVDLPVRNIDGEYCDVQLAYGDVALFSVYDDMSTDKWMELSDAVAEASAADFTCFVLMPDAELAPMDLSDYALSADRKTILMLNRSNGGATWFRDGVVIRKWASSQIPDMDGWFETIEKDADAARMDYIRNGRLRLEGFALYSMLLMIL